MRRPIIYSLLLVILLVMTSCSGGSGGFSGFQIPAFQQARQGTNYYTGTQAVTLEFLDEAPPREVFEGSEFDVQAIIRNDGAFSLVDDYAVEWHFYYDSASVSKPQLISSLQGSYIQPGELIQLYGKSYEFPEGQEEYVAFQRFEAKPVIGNFEEDNAKFYLDLCYPYRTYFSDEICVDTDVDGTNLRQQVCRKEDKSYSRGQGAPVEVTAIESIMVPRGVFVQPQFIIHIQHNADGIISFFDKERYAQQGCGPISQRINETNVNTMNMTVTLGNDTLTCKPNPVFLRNGEARVECILAEDKILGVSSNYLTNLNVELFYLYQQRFDVETSLKRSKLTSFDYEPLDKGEGVPPWEVYHAATQETEFRCDYCARTGGSGPECAIADLSKNSNQPKQFTSAHACVYTELQCYNSRFSEHCIRDRDLCPPGTYCGEPECSFNPKSNRKPKLNYQVEVLDGDITWYCRDDDEKEDLQRTCGCSETGYYAIIDKGLACGGVTSFTPVEGIYNKALQRTSYTALLNTYNPDAHKICLKVVDKMGSETVKRYIPP